MEVTGTQAAGGESQEDELVQADVEREEIMWKTDPGEHNISGVG